MMGWWKRFKVWLLEDPYESPLRDWQPGKLLIFPIVQPTQAECSDVKPIAPDAAETATSPKNTNGESEPVSDEKNDSGEMIMPTIWFPAETIEGEPPERLEHAADLPSATFRVFPTRADNRNGYDSEASVDRAVSARMRRPYDYSSPGGNADSIKVYRAETAWRDVTDEFLRP